MNYEYLNKMIQYIENNITEDIDYKELAKIVGISEYSLQRIFVFLTNISLSEYIRKRRLSRAFQELKNSNEKVIDIAIKYKYDSSISFDKAFKNMFGITPTECRKSESNYKIFPIIRFENNEQYKEINYEIKDIEETIIYAVGVKSDDEEDLLFYIRNLYKNIRKTGLHEKFNRNGMYGIYKHDENKYYYYVGCKDRYDNTEKVVIPKGKYAIFNVGSRKQKEITNADKYIFGKWLPSTNYKTTDSYDIEIYAQDNCYIYVPIIDK